MTLLSIDRRRRSFPAVAGILFVTWPSAALAEVMDKEPGAFELWGSAGLCLTLAVLLSRWKPWLPLAVWPFSALYGAAIIDQLLDAQIGHAIRAEAGIGYMIQAWGLATVDFLGPLFVWLWANSRRRKWQSREPAGRPVS